MHRFIQDVLRFSIPIILIIAIVCWLDFFKIFGFQDYYAKQDIQLNREVVTTQTFNHYRDSIAYNSFIFGSSRSLAFKGQDWAPYLDQSSKTFHFDASSESLWGIARKIEYIDEVGTSIQNALIIVDESLLQKTKPVKGHLAIAMPSVSKKSPIQYYATFLSASLNPKFLTAYLDYSIFNTHRVYMGHLIPNAKYKLDYNQVSCDLWYGMDKEIQEDSIAFYRKQFKKKMFYSRPIANNAVATVTEDEVQLLNTIKHILNKHKSKYKIVISPLYDQLPLSKAQVNILHQTFGVKNVYDFSGKNIFTTEVGNFYEHSHYRPHVAREIMRIIYKD